MHFGFLPHFEINGAFRTIKNFTIHFSALNNKADNDLTFSWAYTLLRRRSEREHCNYEKLFPVIETDGLNVIQQLEQPIRSDLF